MRITRFFSSLVAAVFLLTGCSPSQDRSFNDAFPTAAVINVSGISSVEALSLLSNEGFTNIRLEYNGQTVAGTDELFITEQSASPGEILPCDTEIILSCVVACEVHFQIRSDRNLLFSKYDVNLSLDGEKIATLSNGDSFDKIIKVIPGTHTLVTSRSGSSSINDSVEIDIKTDGIMSSVIEHDRNGVRFKKMNFEETPSKNEPIITVLDTPDKDSENVSPSLEIGQDELRANNTPDEESPAPLTIYELDNVETDAIPELVPVNEPEPEPEPKPEPEAEDEAEPNSGIIPDVAKEPISEVISEQDLISTPVSEPEQENESVPLDPAQLELQNTLNAALPLETAMEAVRVAFVNYGSEDIFTDDGMGYDPSKFHGSEYDGQFTYKIVEKGNWFADSSWAWKAENMLIQNPSFDRAIRLSCNVTCDGQNYIVYNVSFVSAKTSDIDSEDPSRTSGIMLMEPGNDYPFLSLPTYLVQASSESAPILDTLRSSEEENNSTIYDEQAIPDYSPISFDDITADILSDWYHFKSEIFRLGSGESFTLSISIQDGDYSITPDDIILLDLDNCFNIAYSDTNNHGGKTTLKYRISCFTPGTHELAFCTVYDYITMLDNCTFGSFEICQLDDYDGQLVYTTPTGQRRHLSMECAGNNAEPTTRFDAEIWGYDPCGKCGG